MPFILEGTHDEIVKKAQDIVDRFGDSRRKSPDHLTTGTITSMEPVRFRAVMVMQFEQHSKRHRVPGDEKEQIQIYNANTQNKETNR